MIRSAGNLHERGCGSCAAPGCSERAWGADATAQDVIDALRFILAAQSDPVKRVSLLEVLLERAPGTDGDRGIRLVMDLVVDGFLMVETRFLDVKIVGEGEE